MLSKIIVTSYAMLLEVSLWIILAVAFVGGWATSGFFAGLASLAVTFVFCVVFFGAFLLIVDIQKSVKAIEDRQQDRV